MTPGDPACGPATRRPGSPDRPAAGRAAGPGRAGRVRQRAGQLPGAGAAPGRRGGGRAAAARPGGRQQPAGPGARLRVRLRQQRRPARRGAPLPGPDRRLGRRGRPDRARQPVRHGARAGRVGPGRRQHHDPDPRHRAGPDHPVRRVRAGPGRVRAGRHGGPHRRPVADLPAARRHRGAADDPARQLPHGAHLVRRSGAPAGRRGPALPAQRAGQGAGRAGAGAAARRPVRGVDRGRGLAAAARARSCART